jgi:TolB-like protein/Flp pilus assembly protein TadD
MGEDEAGTLASLKSCRKELIEPKIAENHGRIVKWMGDGALIEFSSVVEAVRCAVAIQKGMVERNSSVPEFRRMLFRIAVNVGDVIVENDDLFGDCVNVAARLQQLAEPGGICIRRAVRNEVRDKLPVVFEDLGEIEVKNIARPLRVFRVVVDAEKPPKTAPRTGAPRRHWRWATAAVLALVAAGSGMVAWLQPWETKLEPASRERMAYPLPQKPSIAVLPFANLSGDATQDPIADGFTENIIAALSKISQMFVIASSSVLTYKDKAVQVQRVAEELGVQYVLQGSIQKSGDRLRITAQLIDALAGRHLWSERYDREMKEIFGLQDEITLKIVEALQVELTAGEQARIDRRGTDNLEAWLLVTQSHQHSLRFRAEDIVRARELAQEAIALDPKFAGAYTQLGWTYYFDAQMGRGESWAASLKRAAELARKAVTLDDSFSGTYRLLAAIHLFLRQHDEAIAYIEKAIDLSPNYSTHIAFLAFIKNYTGEPEQAIVLLQKAMRLSPYYPDWYLGELGRAYLLAGRYEEAIAALKQRLERDPDNGEAHVLLAAAYGKLGRKGEARAALEEFLKPRPYYTLRHYAQGEFYKDESDLAHVLDGLRKAGLPE